MKKLFLFLAFSLALFTGCSSKKDSDGFHIGIQLYSVRQDLSRDFYGTLKKVSDMLLRRGFSYDEIRSALRRYSEDTEEE